MDPDSSPVTPREDIVETPEPIEPPAVETSTAPPEPVETPIPAPTLIAVESQNEASESPTPIISTPAQTPFDPHSAGRIDFLKMVLKPKAVAARHAKVAEHLDRLVAHARERGSIDHKEVRLLLIVGKATATRYLSTLVKQGRLTREEKPRGHNDVIYHAV